MSVELWWVSTTLLQERYASNDKIWVFWSKTFQIPSAKLTRSRCFLLNFSQRYVACVSHRRGLGIELLWMITFTETTYTTPTSLFQNLNFKWNSSFWAAVKHICNYFMYFRFWTFSSSKKIVVQRGPRCKLVMRSLTKRITAHHPKPPTHCRTRTLHTVSPAPAHCKPCVAH